MDFVGGEDDVRRIDRDGYLYRGVGGIGECGGGCDVDFGVFVLINGFVVCSWEDWLSD